MSFLREEVENICRNFSKNGYIDQCVKKIIYRAGRGKTRDDTKETKGTAVIPYIRGSSEKKLGAI